MAEVASASKAMEGVTISPPHQPDASGDTVMGDVSASASLSAPPIPAGTIPPPAPAPESVLPPDACETLYIQNLNETVKIEVMKQTLQNLFKTYGPVLDIVAHRNIRMRGQAFVSFADKETAWKACREVKGFPLYAKPMQVSFAKSRSDAVVKKVAAEEFDGHKTARLEHKRKARWDNPHKKKARAKHNAGKTEGAEVATATKRTTVQMPDEYLPPNKILFIQNLPQTATKAALMDLFSQYPNLVEVRMIPTKKDIAFVEYADEASSGAAKDALHNYRLDEEHKIKITFARK